METDVDRKDHCLRDAYPGSSIAEGSGQASRLAAGRRRAFAARTGPFFKAMMFRAIQISPGGPWFSIVVCLSTQTLWMLLRRAQGQRRYPIEFFCGFSI